MPNKFQRSVMERLEQEATRQKKNTPVQDTVLSEEAVPKPDRTAEASSKPEATHTKERPANKRVVKAQFTLEPQRGATPPEPAPAPPVEGAIQLEALLRRGPQRQAKNKTFYLDTDIIAAVHRAAKQQKVADSKLVNDILRAVLATYLESNGNV